MHLHIKLQPLSYVVSTSHTHISMPSLTTIEACRKTKSGHYSLYGQDGYCRNVTSDSPACAWGGTLELNVTDYLRGKKKEEEKKCKELEKRREKRV